MKLNLFLLFIFASFSMSHAQDLPAVSKQDIEKSIDAMVAQGLISAADAKEAKKKLVQMDPKEMNQLVQKGAEMARKPGAQKELPLPTPDTESEED